MDILSIHKSRDLIFNLVARDIKVRYKSSVLGILWSLLKPLFIMAIISLVFTRLKGFSDVGCPYPIYVLTGILSWMFMAGALGESVHSITAHGSLIKKVKINSVVFPVSSVIANFVHFCIAMIVLFLFLLFYKAQIGFFILLLPFVMLIQFLFVVGISLITSSLFVFYRDVASILEVFLMGWFYLTPIFYPSQMIREISNDTIYKIYLLNPQAIILTFFRNTLVFSRNSFFKGFGENGELGIYYLIYIIIFTLLLLLVGNLVYKHYRDSFADEL